MYNVSTNQTPNVMGFYGGIKKSCFFATNEWNAAFLMEFDSFSVVPAPTPL